MALDEACGVTLEMTSAAGPELPVGTGAREVALTTSRSRNHFGYMLRFSQLTNSTVTLVVHRLLIGGYALTAVLAQLPLRRALREPAPSTFDNAA